MRNIMALALIGLCVPDIALASYDVRPTEYAKSSLPHTVNAFDQRATQQSLVFLRGRISELQKENEQLRNSIASIRSQRYAAPSLESAGRLQALIEENNRLANIVAGYDNGAHVSQDYYAQQLYAVQAKNKALQERLKAVELNASMQSQSQLGQYKQENARLKAQLSQGEVQAQSYKLVQGQLTKLQSSNEALRLKLELANKALDAGKAKQKKHDQSAQLSSLERMVGQLKTQNQNLSQQVKSKEAKLQAALLQSATNQKTQDASYTNTIQGLRVQLGQAQSKNNELLMKIKKEQQLALANTQKPQQDIVKLKQQNESLRKTISALNESLVSADNSGQAAERLSNENTALKQQLISAKKAQNSNAGSAKDLFVQNQTLKVKLLDKDKRIAQLEGLTETVKQLRAQNDQGAVNQKQLGELQKKLDVASAQGQSLQTQLDQEKKNSSAYRSKIREYQEKLATMSVQPSLPQSVEPAAGAMGSAEFYKKKVDVLESSVEKQKDAIGSLRHENKKLKAQLSKASKGVMMESEGSFSAEDLLSQDLQPLPQK